MNDQHIKDEFKRGIDLRNESNLKEAVSVFKNILEITPNHPKSAGIRTVLAGVYYDLGDHDNATLNFKKATKLSPKSEMASVGLFHSLVEIGEDDLAMKEIKRYLSDYPIDNYKYIIKELHEESDNILSDEMEKLISEYYQKYSLEKLIT